MRLYRSAAALVLSIIFIIYGMWSINAGFDCLSRPCFEMGCLACGILFLPPMPWIMLAGDFEGPFSAIMAIIGVIANTIIIYLFISWIETLARKLIRDVHTTNVEIAQQPLNSQKKYRQKLIYITLGFALGYAIRELIFSLIPSTSEGFMFFVHEILRYMITPGVIIIVYLAVLAKVFLYSKKRQNNTPLIS